VASELSHEVWLALQELRDVKPRSPIPQCYAFEQHHTMDDFGNDRNDHKHLDVSVQAALEEVAAGTILLGVRA
jgi:hypothetical protein